jgi:hypothetical protein
MADQQLPLDLTRAHAREDDPETSHEAAASVRVVKQRSYVLAAARTLGTFTDPALQLTVRSIYPDQKFSDSGVRTRRSELVRLCFIEDSGQRITLDSGRRAIVWAMR